MPLTRSHLLNVYVPMTWCTVTPILGTLVVASAAPTARTEAGSSAVLSAIKNTIIRVLTESRMCRLQVIRSRLFLVNPRCKWLWKRQQGYVFIQLFWH